MPIDINLIAINEVEFNTLLKNLQRTKQSLHLKIDASRGKAENLFQRIQALAKTITEKNIIGFKIFIDSLKISQVNLACHTENDLNQLALLIADCAPIQALTLECCGLEDMKPASLKIICDAIQGNTFIQELHLPQNKIGDLKDESAQCIIDTVKACRNLTTLGLSHNSLSAKDGQFFIQLAPDIYQHNRIVRLDISFNNFYTLSTTALSRFNSLLQSAHHLVNLNLSGNENPTLQTSLTTEISQRLDAALHSAVNSTSPSAAQPSSPEQHPPAPPSAPTPVSSFPRAILWSYKKLLIGMTGVGLLAAAAYNQETLTRKAKQHFSQYFK